MLPGRSTLRAGYRGGRRALEPLVVASAAGALRLWEMAFHLLGLSRSGADQNPGKSLELSLGTSSVATPK